MDEARRFLRYVTPGLVFGVQALMLLFVLKTSWTWDQLKLLKNDQGAGVAVGLFLASGGFGYLFSVVHHAFHSWDRVQRWSAIDHRAILERLSRLDLLTLQTISNPDDKWALTSFASGPLSRTTAWIIVTAVWKQRLQKEGGIKAADPATSALMDMVHSAGTARIAALFALAATLAIATFIGCRTSEWPMLVQWTGAVVFGACFTALHHFNYLRLGQRAQAVIEQVLADSLAAEKAALPLNPTPSTIVCQ